jgi:hypothetical protein
MNTSNVKMGVRGTSFQVQVMLLKIANPPFKRDAAQARRPLTLR